MTAIGKDAPFDPARKSDLYALTESGWINIRGDNDELRPKFLFGGSFALATRFHALGLLDEGGFTPLGQHLRDKHGRGKADLADRKDSAQ